eukprot:SAG11_NODE_13060_length_672_cov_0.626527_2_plen_97_part_00
MGEAHSSTYLPPPQPPDASAGQIFRPRLQRSGKGNVLAKVVIDILTYSVDTGDWSGFGCWEMYAFLVLTVLTCATQVWPGRRPSFCANVDLWLRRC